MAGPDPALLRPALSLPCRPPENSKHRTWNLWNLGTRNLNRNARASYPTPNIRQTGGLSPERTENVGDFSRTGGKPPAFGLGGGRSFQLEFLNPIPDLVPVEAQKGRRP